MENFFPDDFETRIRRLEEIVFPALEVGLPDPPRSQFSFVAGVDKDAQFSIRFRFALMAVLVAQLCNDSGKMAPQLKLVVQELFDRIARSVAFYQVRVSAVVPIESPLSDYAFCQSALLDRTDQFTPTDIVNGLGLFQEIVAVFGEEANRYLCDANKFGLTEGTFITCITALRVPRDSLVAMEVMALLPALLGEPEDFSEALTASAKNLLNLRHFPSSDQPKTTAKIFDPPPQLATNETKAQAEREAKERAEQEAREQAEPATQHGAQDFKTEDQPRDFPQALMALEYRPEAAEAWSRTQLLPKQFQQRFLQALDTEPTIDPLALLENLEAEHLQLLRPYEDDAANDALEDIRTIGEEAAAEFMKAYSLFSETLSLHELVQRVEKKFGPTARTLAIREAKEQAERDARQAFVVFLLMVAGLIFALWVS